jgi:hypothetical protein
MKNFRFLQIPALVLSLLALQNFCFGQIEQIGTFVAGGEHDAKLLIEPYVAPGVNAFGAALGSGWYNTAEPHKLGGFDITFTSNVAIIPDNLETFKINNAELESFQLADPSKDKTSTIAGPGGDGPALNYNFDNYSTTAFNMPGGLSTNYVPTPMVQAGIGLIKGTEVMIRYMPNMKTHGNEIGFWGLGGKHDIKQWIPGLKHLPILNLSVMYGYTKLHTFVNMEITPATIGAGSLPEAGSSAWDNQKMTMITTSQTGNLVVSGNFPVVCLYGGIGFVSSKTNLKMEGDYPVIDFVNDVPVVKPVTDPISMTIKNKDGSITKPRFNAGIRFKLAIVTIHVDYSWASFSVVTAGLGFSFR